MGTQTDIGSYPVNMAFSPDGKYVLVSDCGYREYLSSMRVSDGSLVSRVDFNSRGENGKKCLYFGLACAPSANGATVYASRGSEGLVGVFTLDADGKLTDTGKTFSCDSKPAPFMAGLAVSSDGGALYAADNTADPKANMGGSLLIFNTSDNALRSRVALPGYPYAVAALAKGPSADKKVYVTSEQRGEVSVVDPASGTVTGQIVTGMQPIGLLFNASQTLMYVANAGSDTVSVVDTATDRVTNTILLRPSDERGLPCATPIALSLSPDERTLYVTMADMNAVAVVDLPRATVKGYLPTGWYPTGIVASPDGKALLVANAKGVSTRYPNNVPRTNLPGRKQYIQNIIEGSVSRIDLTGVDLKAASKMVYANNMGRPGWNKRLVNPGIKHVIYIIKENRTFDQILGDDPAGNGDPSVCMFPKNVTPNEHALADRFVMLDNFYCCAEVSGDGWNFSTAGMASEYVSRNVPYSYSDRTRPYDFEGSNNGVQVDRQGIPDVATPPGGYIWDDCLKHGVSMRDYGCFTDDVDMPRSKADQGTAGTKLEASKKALAAVNDDNVRPFDLSFADSDAWVQDHLTLSGHEIGECGAFKSPSRYSEWKREFDGYVKNGNLPQFTMMRLCRDHTGGTRPGLSSPQAMVADNDYAVGEVVDAVSKSPYWKSTAIIILEDDAQNGYDHVDAHRSTAYVISPFVRRSLHDGRFYNTDSALKTIELLLGLSPMSQYDAIAPPFDVFDKTPSNDAPYDAILPDKSIISERNEKNAYRAAYSAKYIELTGERSGPDEQLNDILWRSIMHSTPPPRRHGLQLLTAVRRDDDD
jgi:YVTN family beta-propeller protein